jgi:hypothetical protein
MMQKSKIIGRFLLIFSMASGVSVVSNWSEWNQYWNETIYRVQTVDFNILSHTLPAKLSPILAKKKYKELQQTLDSNYGLFGLVVTNCDETDKLCKGQEIIFASNGKRDWKKLVSSKDLSAYSYDLLRTPSPLVTERVYENPGSTEATLTNRINKGEIIGRVYYIRGIPPDFVSDYTNWLANLSSKKGAHSYYALKTISFIFVGIIFLLFIELLLYRKRIQFQKSTQERKELQHQFDEIINRNSEHIAQQKYLLTQQEKSINELDRSRQNYQKHIQKLSKDIEQLISSQSQRQDKLQGTAQLLVTRQQELEVAYTSKLLPAEQLKQREFEINQLQQEMNILRDENQIIISNRSDLYKELERTKQKFANSIEQIREFETNSKVLSSSLNQSLKENDELKQQLESTPDIAELKKTLEEEQIKSISVKRSDTEYISYIAECNKKLEGENNKLNADKYELQ